MTHKDIYIYIYIYINQQNTEVDMAYAWLEFGTKTKNFRSLFL